MLDFLPPFSPVEYSGMVFVALALGAAIDLLLLWWMSK